MESARHGIDQFSFCGEIPDARGYRRTQDWLSRGLKMPAGRGWEAEPLPERLDGGGSIDWSAFDDDDEDDNTPRPAPAKPPLWPHGWEPGDPPVQLAMPGQGDPFSFVRAFDTHARVRFLDRLATGGSVSSAAACIGVSRETVYRARRKFPEFAQMWDAALVLARRRAESELAERAFHGVEIPVFVRGEMVATWQRQDARYLFAHLGRLDAAIERNPAAAARADQFDTLLAAMAGQAMPECFAEVAEGRSARSGLPPDVPPSRTEYIVHARSEVLGWSRDPTFSPEEAEALQTEAMEELGEDAAKYYDAHVAERDARLDSLWDQEGESAFEAEARAVSSERLAPMRSEAASEEDARTAAPDALPAGTSANRRQRRRDAAKARRSARAAGARTVSHLSTPPGAAPGAAGAPC